MNVTHSNFNQSIENMIIGKLKQDYPQWVGKDGSCERCEKYYRILQKLLSFENIYHQTRQRENNYE